MLEFQNVSYIYGEGTPFRKVAVDNVSFAIPEGKVTGLIGHTGSGKSTLMQLRGGLLQPKSGQVLINGQDIFLVQNVPSFPESESILVFA